MGNGISFREPWVRHHCWTFTKLWEKVKVFGRPSPSHAVISSAWGLSYPCCCFFICFWGKTFSGEKTASTRTTARGLLSSPAGLLSPPPPSAVPGPPGTPHGSCRRLPRSLPLRCTSTAVTPISQTPGNLNPPTDLSGSLGARRAFCRAPALSHASPAGSTLQDQGLGAPTSPQGSPAGQDFKGTRSSNSAEIWGFISPGLL